MKEPTTKSHGQRDKILAWLRMRGAQGVLNTELNGLCMRFGARIYELRKEGHVIETHKLSEGQFRFILSPSHECRTCGKPMGVIGLKEENRYCDKCFPAALDAQVAPAPLAHEYRNQSSLFA
jgi:hypothetical protein